MVRWRVSECRAISPALSKFSKLHPMSLHLPICHDGPLCTVQWCCQAHASTRPRGHFPSPSESLWAVHQARLSTRGPAPLPAWMVTVPPAPLAPYAKGMDVEGSSCARGDLMPLQAQRRSSGVQRQEEGWEHACAGLWPPPSLARHCLWAGTSTPAPTPPRTPAGTAAYSKSPSWYLPKAWRITVLTAMSGFTTQNCRVACGEKPQVRRGTDHVTPPLAADLLDARPGGAQGPPPRGEAVWRRQSEERYRCDSAG